jgi:hypothetical protein
MDMAGSPWFVSGIRAPPGVRGGKSSAEVGEKHEGEDELDVRWGSPAFSRPRSLGIEGPKMSRSSTPTRARCWVAREKARFTWGECRYTSDLIREIRERTNRQRYSCLRRPYRWQRRRPFSRSECHAWAEGHDAASSGFHLASVGPAKRGELVHARCRNKVLRYERVVMAQSA